MEIKRRMVFTGYFIIALFLAGNGIVYLLADRIMPYHLAAMGTTWDAMTAGMQVMTLSFMKSAATGFLSTAAAIIFLLLIPFRRKENWANWALLIISLNELCLLISRIAEIRAKTTARPPILPFLILAGDALVCFAILQSSTKKERKENDRLR